jgi:hypothetical protein
MGNGTVSMARFTNHCYRPSRRRPATGRNNLKLVLAPHKTVCGGSHPLSSLARRGADTNKTYHHRPIANPINTTRLVPRRVSALQPRRIGRRTLGNWISSWLALVITNPTNTITSREKGRRCQDKMAKREDVPALRDQNPFQERY